MTTYLLSVHGAEGAPMPPANELEEAFRDVDALNQKIQAAGAWVFAGGLQPASTATVVRAQAREGFLVTDGPFVEAREHIGGFWIIQAPDLDAALAWAKQATVACRAPVEVRPFQDDV